MSLRGPHAYGLHPRLWLLKIAKSADAAAAIRVYFARTLLFTITELGILFYFPYKVVAPRVYPPVSAFVYDVKGGAIFF